MKILGKKVTLRAIEEDDLELLHKWANDPVTQDGIGEIHFPSSMQFQKSWFDQLKSDRLNQRFAVDTTEFGIIGLSSIMKIDWRNRHAWHGLVLGESTGRGRGYGKDAIMATMRYAFDELNLERLDGSMIEYNAASLAVYCSEKVGWKKEGVRRNYYFRKGRFWDQVIVGVTKNDYNHCIQSYGYWD